VDELNTFPENESLANRKRISREEAQRLIEELRGICAGGPSMCDELLEDRRFERERELTEEGW